MSSDDIIVIDNIITKSYQNAILDRVTAHTFPWYFNPNLITPNFAKGKEYMDSNPVGLNHFLFEDGKVDSPFFDFLYPLILSIQDMNMFPKASTERMRMNLTQRNPNSTKEHHLPHIDSFYEHWNVIYYVNDNDGPTYIFNDTNKNYEYKDQDFMLTNNFSVKQKIYPKKGRIVAFPGFYYHASSFCKEFPYRIVLNINFSGLQDVLQRSRDT